LRVCARHGLATAKRAHPQKSATSSLCLIERAVWVCRTDCFASPHNRLTWLVEPV
jgi:hypothetical protein